MKAQPAEDGMIAAVARAIGEPARTRILLSLMDGQARTSTELAALAEVMASTASAHLNCLREAGLIRVAAEGRHRYYSLGGADVARVLEGLGVLTGRSVKKFVPSTPEPLRKARSCYDHMAGELAVALHDHFFERGWLVGGGRMEAGEYALSGAGVGVMEGLGIDVGEARRLRRRFAYGCLDWSERRPHVGGALGAALLEHALRKRWVARELSGRALRLTKLGQREARARLGIEL